MRYELAHCTNLPLYAMHIAHANVSLYSVYIRSNQASRLASLQIVILPNGANHTNKLQPIRKRQTSAYMGTKTVYLIFKLTVSKVRMKF